MTKHLLLFVLLLGFFSALGQQPESQETSKTISLVQVDLLTTTSEVLSLQPKAGMTVYNTYEKISGTLAYPAIGRGIYTYDGSGWVANKVKEIPAIKPDKMDSYLSNAVVLLPEGTFKTPPAASEAGRYFYVRNTSASQSIFVSQVIDFGEIESSTIELKPKAGAMMIYSDGTAWYRIN